MIRVSRLNDIPISKTEFDECNCLPYGLFELKSGGYIILLNLNLIWKIYKYVDRDLKTVNNIDLFQNSKLILEEKYVLILP